MLYGVLHMALNYCHMEYSIWRFSGTIWSALQLTLNEQYKCYLKYSIWSLFDAIWSTPCGRYFLPYGVLYIITMHVNCGRYAKSSIRLVSMLYGVLHMALNYCHMKYSICRFSGIIWGALQLTLSEHY